VGNHTVTWASVDREIATVSSAGKVTGVGAGRTKVRATAGDKTTEVAVTVDPVPAVPVDTVVVSPSPASVREGSTVQLSAVTRDPDGKVLAGRAITWASSNDNVAGVNENGLVTGKSAGSATITATSEGKSAASTVEVTPSTIPVATVSMNRTS